MFKYTQSITNQQPKQQIQHIPKMNIDLFDLLNNYDQQDEEDIQTFGQLKQWINTYKFSANQQKSQVEPRMMEPKIKIDRGKFSLDRRIQSMELSQNYLNDSSLGPKLSGNHFLQVIQQDAKSRASKKPKRRSSQNYTIQFGSPQIPQNKQKQSHGQFINGNNNEGSIKKSSAHSSRSFNGYDLINQYQVKDKLGQGAFSNVYQCIDIHSDKKYAMKTLQKKSFRKKLFRKNSLNLAQNYIQNEIAILKKMQHPYIIKLHEVIADEQKQKSYLILDYCAKGFICQNRNNQNNHQQQSQKRRYKRLLESQCKRYFKQFCLGLNYIHNVAKIAHRDIKPQNILLSQKDQVKISDFGLGTEDIEIRSKSGTRNFLPPQIINKTQQTSQKINIQKGDVWASGITLLIMLTGRNIDQQVTQLPKIIQKLKDVSQQCKKFIEVCLEINPEKRITSKQMLQHPWINIKQTRQYEEIVVSKEDQEKAIISRLNKEILSAVTKLKL